jgi:hypothetical protein
VTRIWVEFEMEMDMSQFESMAEMYGKSREELVQDWLEFQLGKECTGPFIDGLRLAAKEVTWKEIW